MLTEDAKTRRDEHCLSDLQLDQLAVGELEGASREMANAHLETCERCQTRRDALGNDEAALPPLDLRAASESEAVTPLQPRNSNRRVGIVVVTLLAAAAVVFFVLRRPPTPGRGADGSNAPLVAAARLRGGASIGAFVRRDGRVEPWAAGEALHSGDTLAFTYSSDIDQTLGLFLVQGKMIEILHQDAGQTAAIDRGRDVELGLAIELDAEDASEVAVAVFCLEPTRTKMIRLALAVDPSAQRLPPGCGATAIPLRRTPSSP